MSGQNNKQSKSLSSHNSDWGEEYTGPDVTGIYDTSDQNRVVHHSLRRMCAHLRKINEALESLDSELVQYRACIKDKLLGKLNNSRDSDAKLWWHHEISNEMKVFHFYESFCMKLLCKDFCLEHYPIREEVVEV